MEIAKKPDNELGSHPSRVRGLKLPNTSSRCMTYTVAPFTGAWIEIAYARTAVPSGKRVAPFTGAWIEISSNQTVSLFVARRTLHGCVD